MRYDHFSMLPERAFQKKLGSYAPATLEGGGGSPAPAPAQPTQTQVTNTNIPEYARPYVENMLGATQQQLFNTSTDSSGNVNINGIKPYVPYSQNPTDYFAGFSPMQQQVQQGVAGMQVPGQYNQGSALTGMAGVGSMQAGQNFQNMATNPNAVQSYMNPYLQASLNPQLAEIQRQYDITGQQQAGQATQAGAFGGGRDAVMAAENARNKNTAMNQAIGQGYNTAFNNAQNQMNAGAQLNLQGLGQAGQAGANLANIGGQQLQAQQGIYGLQNQVGAQQQAAQQDIINQQIQNYAVAQQYPQQQLSFMNAMLRGLPMQSGTTQMYQAAPSAISQAAGLGTAGIAGLGLYNTMSGGKKAGGAIKSYASGGIADIDKRILLSPDKYSVQQIQNGMQNGVINKLIGDPVLADKIKEQQMASAPQPQQQPTIDQQINEQAARLSRGAHPPMQQPQMQQPQMQPQMQAQQPQGLPAAQSNLPTFNAYDGGIVAFGDGGDVKHFKEGDSVYSNFMNAINPYTPENQKNPGLISRLMQDVPEAYKKYAPNFNNPFVSKDAKSLVPKNYTVPNDLENEAERGNVQEKALELNKNIPGSGNYEPMKIYRDKKPSAPPPPAPTPSLPTPPDGIADLGKSQKSDIAELKDLIMGSREDPDKALKQNALLAALKGGFKMASGTSPYAMANIGAGGEEFANSLGQGIDKIQANKQAQVGQLVALGLKGAELNQELQKLGITKAYYDMHAPLFAAQAAAAAQQGPLYASQAQYYRARAANPPGSGGGMSLGSINPKDYFALKDKYAALGQNPKSDPAFFASLDKDTRDALNTPVGSPSYQRGIEAVQGIAKNHMARDINEARILGAKKASFSMLPELD
jgi:hypothetical protein